MTDEQDVNPWTPMTEPKALKILGKAQEELGECQAAIARCIIQGIEECHPTTGVLNKVWLEDEVADVYAQLRHLEDYFSLNIPRMLLRAERKYNLTGKWHEVEGTQK